MSASKQRPLLTDPARVVSAASDEMLQSSVLRQTTAIHWSSFEHEGRCANRRTIPDILADLWRDYRGTALRSDRRSEYELPDIDDLFGSESDPEFGEIRRILDWAKRAPHHTIHDARKLEQLRVLDLTVRIAGPLKKDQK